MAVTAMGRSGSQTDFATPEALRSRAPTVDAAPTRPGEKTPARTPSSVPKSPSKMGGKLRRCGHALSFVPWAALLSLGLLVGGLTLVAIKGMAAADAADQLIQQVGSNVGTGFPRYMTIFRTSVWAMVGVAGAGVAALVLAASVRLDQKLRKAGKYRTAKGSYSPVLFNFYGFVDWVGLILAVLLALWVAVAGVMLASWAAQCWNLSEGAAVASANMAALDGLAAKYQQSLDAIGAAVALAAGGTSAVQLNSIERGVPGVSSVAAAPSTAPVPEPAAPSPVPAVEVASAPAPAGVVSATSLAAPGVPPTTITPTTTPTTSPLNITVQSALATLRLYVANLTAVERPANVTQDSGLCPSAACLNMALYPFLESAACMCTTNNLQSVGQLAGTSKDTAVWVLVGVAGLFAGSVLAVAELSADAVLLSADNLFLRVIKRKSRSTSRSGSRKEEEPGMGQGDVSSPSMPRARSYPYVMVNASTA